MAEQIQEEGTVTTVQDGLATISVLHRGDCRECGARILCKASGEENPSVIARDPLGVQPGDRVRISAPGESILLASCILYGIPLAALLLGIALGPTLFPRDPELYGSLLGIGLCAVYYLVLRLRSSRRPKDRFMPRIETILAHGTDDSAARMNRPG